MSNKENLIHVYHYHIVVSQNKTGNNISSEILQSITSSSAISAAVPLPNKSDSNQENRQEASNESNEDVDELYTIAEFAEYFKINQITARKWVSDGKIPHIRIGRRIRIRKAEILKLERRS